MILIRGLDRWIGSKALALGIIIVLDSIALPALFTLDAEVVVRATRKVAIAAIRLEDSLRHSDTCRDSITLHMGNGYRLILLDILLARLALLGSH